jgi:hypothetical protein
MDISRQYIKTNKDKYRQFKTIYIKTNIDKYGQFKTIYIKTNKDKYRQFKTIDKHKGQHIIPDNILSHVSNNS